MSVFAVSCRAAPPLPEKPQAAAGTPTAGPTALTFWHSETGAARVEIEALARDFASTYPDITVTPMYVGSEADLAKQVIAAVALDHTPDVVLATRHNVVDLMHQDGVVALERLMADADIGFTVDDNSDFFPGILDEGAFREFDNKHLSMPFDEEGLVLFYNVDLLKSVSRGAPPVKWDDFADAASVLTKDQQYGWAMYADADTFSAMMVSRGSALLDDPEKRVLFAERGGVAAMSLVSQLSKSGAAHLLGSRDAATDEFAQGRAGFLFGWMSELPALRAAQQRAGTDFEIGIANVPQSDPSNPSMLIRGSDLVLLKTNKERERHAWFLVRWLTAPQQAARWARAADAIPLRDSALGFLAADLLTNPRFRQIQKAAGGTVPHFVPQSVNPRIGLIEKLVEDTWSQIALTKVDIIPTLNAAAAQANQFLASNQ